MSEQIYVIEDDENIQEIIQLALESNGYHVTCFDNAITALESMNQKMPDLAIFDVMLPQMDGITAVKKIREKDKQVPILILSAKDSELDKIRGLDGGSDDYMTKPFGVLELCARIRTLLRRTQKHAAMIITSTLKVNKNTHEVKQGDTLLELTNKEYQLLLYLMENRDRVVERNELLNEIWGPEFVGESRALDVHIRALRKILQDDKEKYIKTVRSVGYRFIEE